MSKEQEIAKLLNSCGLDLSMLPELSNVAEDYFMWAGDSDLSDNESELNTTADEIVADQNNKAFIETAPADADNSENNIDQGEKEPEDIMDKTK